LTQPAAHADQILINQEELAVVYDGFAKAAFHVLLLPKPGHPLGEEVVNQGPASLQGVHSFLVRVLIENALRLSTGKHLPALQGLHGMAAAVGEALSAQFPGSTCRIGYHAVPSMRPMHIHIISEVH